MLSPSSCTDMRDAIGTLGSASSLEDREREEGRREGTAALTFRLFAGCGHREEVGGVNGDNGQQDDGLPVEQR